MQDTNDVKQIEQAVRYIENVLIALACTGLALLAVPIGLLHFEIIDEQILRFCVMSAFVISLVMLLLFVVNYLLVKSIYKI